MKPMSRQGQLYESLGFQRAEMCATVPPKRRKVLSLNDDGERA